MRKAIIVLIAAAIFGTATNKLRAQDTYNRKQWLEKHPIEFAIGNFSVGMPFAGLFIDKFYPYATLGSEFYYRNRKHAQVY